jgi:peptide-methionine (R)-S-oxide reductase
MSEHDAALHPELDLSAFSEADWRSLLRPEEFRILRQAGTERAFTGPHLDEQRAGSYHCAGCGAGLYDATHKFHSGCGWPSFFSEIAEGAITTHRDTTHGMVRVEMRCARCGGHLGHIFEDAPHQPTGLRHCVNGAALVFVPQGASFREVFEAHRAC